MELKQFIKEALINIVEGVENANKERNQYKLIGQKHHVTGKDGMFAEFDVSVLIEESSGGEAAGGAKTSFLSVVSAGVDAKMTESSAYQNTHRLAFKVFVAEDEFVVENPES